MSQEIEPAHRDDEDIGLKIPLKNKKRKMWALKCLIYFVERA